MPAGTHSFETTRFLETTKPSCTWNPESAVFQPLSYIVCFNPGLYNCHCPFMSWPSVVTIRTDSLFHLLG